MMTLEQIGQLALLWEEARADAEARYVEGRPVAKAAALRNRRAITLSAAIRDYKLLQEAKGKGVNDGTV